LTVQNSKTRLTTPQHLNTVGLIKHNKEVADKDTNHISSTIPRSANKKNSHVPTAFCSFIHRIKTSYTDSGF